MYGFHQAQLLSNMAIGIFTLRQQLRGLLSKNWTGTIKTPYVEYLVVGGGGGATNSGAGAGGLLTGLLPVTAGTSITVTVGGGGAGGTINTAAGTQGGDSVLGPIRANGGARSNISDAATFSGGSGAGAPSTSTSIFPSGQGIAGQGNAGGANSFSSTPYPSGGGGGAGTVGLNASASAPGNGGAGIASSISGTVTPYAGGGGGGMFGTGTASVGGVGGGGVGGASGGGNGGAGQDNTGGGGGGGVNSPNTGGAGGSGIVIISYPDIYAPLTTTGSPTVSTSGSGSISFNGSSQYLSVASNTAFSFPADFTFECWVYLTTATGTKTIFTNRSSVGAAGIAWVAQSGSAALSIYTNSAFSAVSSTALSLNTWTHVALTRSGSTITQWLNGVSVATVTNSSAFTEAQCYVGANNSAVEFWPGYITNLRILKGTALYTSTFTPPTAPLSVITNTSLLLSSISGAPFSDSSTNGFAPNSSSAVAPTWNQSSPFATGLGYKNRVYSWTTTGSGTFTV